MAVKKKITRKRLLKEPDEFITTTGRVLRWGSENRRIIAVFTIFLMISIIAILGWRTIERKKETRAATLYNEAYRHYRDGMEKIYRLEENQASFREALKGFDELVEKYGGTHYGNLAQLYRGNSLYELKEYEKAADAFRAFLSQSNSKESLRILAYNGMGYSYMALGKYREAIPYFEKIIEASGNILSEESLINIGRCYEAMQDFSQALKIYQQVLNENPDSFSRFVLKGKIARMLAKGGQETLSEIKGAIKDEGKGQ